MNYKVLYRKYRPDSFESLIGQENTVKILKNSLITDKIAHAYIFSGPRGTGKTSSAKIFAKSVNCLDLNNGNPCGKCVNCENFSNSHDIIEIDAASNNGVDEIREITNNIKLAPNALKYKVYIIDEVHMLSQSAFNALLLTLEEPPSHVLFILATTNIESVPITILSRCQRFDFRKINEKDIEKHLKLICEQEDIDITEEAIEEISYLSDGGMRDSLSLLDQLSKENNKIDVDSVLSVVGNISKQNVKLILDYLEDKNYTDLINLLEDLSSKSLDSKILIKSLIDEVSIRVKNLVIGNYNSKLSVSKYKKLVFDLSDLMNKINVNLDVFQILIITLINIVIDDEVVVVNNNKVILNDIENKVGKEELKSEKRDIKSEKLIEKNENLSEIKKIRINNCFFGVKKESKLFHVDNWKEFLLNVDSKYKGILYDTLVLAASEEILIIGSEISNNIKELDNNYKIFEEIYSKLVKNNVKLVFLSLNEWKVYSDEYVQNLKNGIKYNYIEELPNNNCELTQIANDIFGDDIIQKG